eukprot:scaffold264711_cov40-Prasinocladus_malaysianus.AAC.1
MAFRQNMYLKRSEDIKRGPARRSTALPKLSGASSGGRGFPIVTTALFATLGSSNITLPETTAQIILLLADRLAGFADETPLNCSMCADNCTLVHHEATPCYIARAVRLTKLTT